MDAVPHGRLCERGLRAEDLAQDATAPIPWDSQRHSGWYIGGGVDMAVSHGWTIGLEYRHYEFDDATYQVSRTIAGNNQVGVIDLSQPANRADATSDIVTLRASWKFGRPEAAPLK